MGTLRRFEKTLDRNGGIFPVPLPSLADMADGSHFETKHLSIVFFFFFFYSLLSLILLHPSSVRPPLVFPIVCGVFATPLPAVHMSLGRGGF
jgi:hypothetical protein